MPSKEARSDDAEPLAKAFCCRCCYLCFLECHAAGILQFFLLQTARISVVPGIPIVRRSWLR